MNHGKKIYIGNLAYKINEKSLYGIFGKFGKIKSVNLLTKPGTTQSRGIAFLEMFNTSEADKAIKALDGTIIDDRTVKVSWAIENEEKPVKKIRVTEAAPDKKQRGVNVAEIVRKKKTRRRSGLDILFENTRS